jgi:flagellar basal-body rod modification protein FlgD
MNASVPYSVTSRFLYDDHGNIAGISDAEYRGDMSGELWKETNKMGKDSFLLLLMTQLKYQDPLSPMENSDFVAQLAQFSALENAENTERAVRELAEAFNENVSYQMFSAQSVANSSAMSLIGKEVRMAHTKVNWTGNDTQIPIRVHLGNADSATVEIRNAEGDVIRTISATGKDAENSVTVYWDGRLDNGETASVGEYAIGVRNPQNNSSLYTFVQAMVEGVRFTENGVMVKIDGREIHIAEVLDVSMGEENDGISRSSALALMGKLVRARHDTIQHNATVDAEHGIMINAPRGQQVNVEIRNSAGTLVQTLRGNANEFGFLQLFWDGTGQDGLMAPAGGYKINIVGSENNPNLYAYTEGLVEGLTSLTGDFKLRIEGGAEVAISDIISILSVSTQTSTAAS